MLEVEFKEQIFQAYFYELIEHLWPKYLQAFFNEMASDLRCKTLTLDDSEFNELPESWMDNLKDFALFEDYLTADMQIEMCRAIKLRSCQLIVQMKNK
jgi:hypothetical protein